MKKLFYIAAILLLALSCTKEDDSSDNAPVANFTIRDAVDRLSLISNSSDIDGDSLSCKWSTSTEGVTIYNAYLSSAYILLTDTTSSIQAEIELVVNDGRKTDALTKTVTIPQLSLQRTYGLGINLDKETSNNVNYSWYFDQMNTGQYANVNCGPTSVTMAIKWANESFDKTPEDARNTYHSDGGWWYTDDMVNYLNLYSISNSIVGLPGVDSIKSQLDAGNIVILCLDMYYIRKEDCSDWHVDKFYNASTTGWGHFIIIKGYKIVDGYIFYEAYDPFSYGVSYSDGNIKGKNRYYRGEDLDKAVQNWWPYAIIVSNNGLKSAENSLDIRNIPNMPGR